MLGRRWPLRQAHLLPERHGAVLVGQVDGGLTWLGGCWRPCRGLWRNDPRFGTARGLAIGKTVGAGCAAARRLLERIGAHAEARRNKTVIERQADARRRRALAVEQAEAVAG